MKSLYKKQVTLYIGILLATFAVMAVIMYFSLSDNYIERQKNELISLGGEIQGSMAELYYDGAAYNEFQSTIQILEDYMGAQVFFVTNTGKISMVSSGIGDFWIGRTITNETVDIVLSGNIAYVEGNVGGMFTDKVLTVGYPITFGGYVQGGIFMCKSMPEIKDNFFAVYRNVIGFTALALIIGAALVIIFTRRIVRPISEMSKAARVIADGNFDNRIEISTDDEIGQLAESFNYMAESLNENEQMRRELIANISHDLRSPLTSIQGFLGAIADGTIPQENAGRYINIALEESGRLSKMVENVMDMNRAQAGIVDVNKEDFSINDLMRKTAESLETRMRDKNIKVNLNFDNEKSMVYADYNKIQRVLQNLFDNAVKFTPVGGNITAETTAEDNKIKISVKNSGAPLSEEERKHIFERFYKGDRSRGECCTGSGLGLAIVKELLKAHGAAISVNSGEDCNEFVFSLETAKAEE